MAIGSYSYKFLPEYSFRLLLLKMGYGRTIECEIFHKKMYEKHRYEAVSYTWGEDEEADTVSITEANSVHTLPITFSLSLILRDLRSPTEDRMLWIDAICINQNDTAEKGPQVQQMGDIFRNAERVLFCIGQPTEMSDLLMTSLQKLEKQNSHQVQANETELDCLRPAWEDIQLEMEKEHFCLRQKHREGLAHILNHPWFSRVWIIQEVANAHDALLYCGRKSISARIFAYSPILTGIYKYDPEHRWRPKDQRYQPILNLMLKPRGRYPETKCGRDLYSLLTTFSSAKAKDERDRIYALYGMCSDPTNDKKLEISYVKPDRDVIRATISYICGLHCLSDVPYADITAFFNRLDLLDNDMLLQLLVTSDIPNLLSILERRREFIYVTMEMVEMVCNTEMLRAGVTELLLKQEGTDNALSERGSAWTPLWWAAEEGHETIVKLLLHKGADVDAEDKNGWTALRRAAEQGHEAVVKLLLDNGADVKAKRTYNGTALQVAAREGHEGVVRLLLNKSANLDAKGRYDRGTALEEAARNGHEAVVKLLLNRGVDVDAKDKYGGTSLSLAAQEGHEAVIKLLLNKGVNVDANDIHGDTALKGAAREGHEGVVRLLLDKGASLDAKGRYDGETALQEAAQQGHDTIVKLILDKGADVAVKDIFDRRAALKKAAKRGHKAVVELLRDKGADLDAKELTGGTALEGAVQGGHEAIVELQLQR